MLRVEKSEDSLIAWIAARYPSADLPIGIGDDMAMLPACPAGLLVTVDMLMDGVDFKSAHHTPKQIGRKALAAGLSDCAAMAVRPRWALVSVALPDSWSMSQAQELLMGMEELAGRYDCRIVGGDTNSWDQPLVIDVIVIAEPWPGIAPVRRNGLREGDLICVTGELGGSLAGHHLDFEPRVREARWLAEHLGSALHGMMDLSDGLSIDARRMAEASGLGIVLDAGMGEAVASHAARSSAEKDGRSCLEHVLHDGEDFELLLAVEPGAWGRLLERTAAEQGEYPLPMPRLSVIGEVVGERGLWLQRAGGQREPLQPRGWRHFQG